MLISRQDLAKYPFIKQVSEYVKTLDLRIDELKNPEYAGVVKRSEERINDALINGFVKTTDQFESEIEILSFPVAVLFVSRINDDYLKKRYALAEAKGVYDILRNDDNNKIVEIANTTFGWTARVNQSNKFFLCLGDYLRNSTSFHENNWKLINKTLAKGEVILEKNEFARLLQEEVCRHIESIIDNSPKIMDLDPSLLQVVERINQKLEQRRKEAQIQELPNEAVSVAYPPCIQDLYNSLLTRKHISHMGRFTLTSFLLIVGMKANDLTKLYTSLSDFDREQTQYQIEHIAGVKGSRVKYKPPNCSTLKTHNLCLSADNICMNIRHPLSYYRLKLRLMGHRVDEKWVKNNLS